MTTRLGLGSYALTWSVGVPGYPAPAQPIDAFALLAFAADLGLRVVQFADNLPLHALVGGQRAALRAEADQRGIAVEIGARGIQPDALLPYLDIAREFSSPILRVVMDTAEHHPSIDEAAAILTPLMPRFAEAGVTLAIENHDRFKSAQLADLIARIDHPNVGICLDTVNSFGALEGPEIVVAALKPYVVNLHVKEFVVRRAPHNLGFVVTGAPIGSGMLDIPWLLAELSATGRDFNAILEQWPPLGESIDETAEREQAWAHAGVAYLRQYIQE